MSIEKNDIVIVNREVFDQKFREYVDAHSKGNKTVWNIYHEKNVIKCLSENDDASVKKTAQHYHFGKLYELVKIGNKIHVVLKRKNTSDPFIYLICYENYFEKLLEAHVQTGHGGRDRMHFYTKNKWVISIKACAIFASLCQVCVRKRAAPKKGVVVKPILSNGFNVRGQVDLIDFQSCPDGEYKFLMNLQDHGTKFLHLRPLSSKHAVNVAEELFKIFQTWGAPQILHSDNGREFVAEVCLKTNFFAKKNH